MKAVAAMLMLRRRRLPGKLHYGAKMAKGGPIETHVWLESGNQPIVGYVNLSEYTELASWTSKATECLFQHSS